MLWILLSCTPSKGKDNHKIIKVTINGTIEKPYLAPTWSPNGKHIAFIRGGDLYIADQDGKNIRHFKTKGMDVSYMEDNSLSWSLDSKYLAMVICRGSTCSLGVFDTENSEIKAYFSSQWLSTPTWSYIGKKQFVSVMDNSNQLLETPLFKTDKFYKKHMKRKVLCLRSKGNVYIDENDSLRKDIKVHRVFSSLSNDKNYLVIKQSPNILLIDLNNKKSREIIHPFSKGYYIVHQLFSYDNSKIIFNLMKDNHYSIENCDIAIFDLKTKSFKKITDTKNKWEEMPSLSPDNKKIVYEERTDGNIYMIKIKE